MYILYIILLSRKELIVIRKLLRYRNNYKQLSDRDDVPRLVQCE
jgi:hypothetical protein